MTKVLDKTALLHSPLRERKRGAVRGSFTRVLKVLVIGGFVLASVIPLVWLLLSTFKTSAEFTLEPAYSLPSQFNFDNYLTAWGRGSIGRYFINTTLVVVPSILMILGLSLTAAFAFHPMRWKGSKLVLASLIGGILVPAQMIIVPLFTSYHALGMLNELWSLIPVHVGFTLPLSILLAVGYIRSLPKELIEAAIVDGASIYQVFRHVVVPLMMNSLGTITILAFLLIWSDLLFTLTFISDPDALTIQAGLLAFSNQWGGLDWGPMLAAIVMTIAPVLLLYLFLNRRIIRGLTQGAVKG